MYILGINAYHADASAAIILDGKLIAAVEEERFTRIKHTAGFPSNAVRYCLQQAGIKIQDVSYVAIPRKRSAQLFRKLFWAVKTPGFAIRRANVWQKFSSVKEELAIACGVSKDEIKAEFNFVEHHIAHAASAFYCSPHLESAILTLDGLGDFSSMVWGKGLGNKLNVEGRTFFPHSLGLYYSAICQYLGFNNYGDEYKVMGLAPYGKPKYLDTFRNIVQHNKELNYNLDLEYFTHHRSGADISWSAGKPLMPKLFSNAIERDLGPARLPNEPLKEHHYDIASSLQTRLEEIIIGIANELYEKTGSNSLCYAGGVAFNCVVNGKILSQTPFENIYIQPAAGDAGLAIGGAAYLYHHSLGNKRSSFVMDHAYWGPEYSEDLIKGSLISSGLDYVEMDDDVLAKYVAERISEGDIVGWYQGRSEWGPRALGNRSIVADPRRAEMKDILNSRIKHREDFRPFAPSILEEFTAEWFEQEYQSPFMQMTYQVNPNKVSDIPAPTHVDGSGRLQTVNASNNQKYYKLIKEFHGITGIPVVVNTSFNDNEPIVNTPDEAIASFMRTKMDTLAIGPYFVRRK